MSALPAVTATTRREQARWLRKSMMRAERETRLADWDGCTTLGSGPVIALPAFRLDTVECLDAFELMRGLPDSSVDMVLCDLPYGTTKCAWDEIIPIEAMWNAFKRLITPRGVIVLTASQPFTSKLVMSNLEMFRYEWVWEKPIATQFMNANYRPLKAHESILVFSLAPTVSGAHAETAANYYPQIERDTGYKSRYIARRGLYEGYNLKQRLSTFNDGTRYPRSVVHFSNGKHESYHPTQKPVDLFEYLIKTYTQPGEIVLDPTCGSGTTALAARNTGRHWICGDNGYDERSGQTWADVARKRLNTPYTPAMPLLLDMPATAVEQQAALW